MTDPIPRRQFLASTALLAGACALGGARGAAQSTKLGVNSHYASNRAPLAPTPFVALPLGSVRARGWLLKQLELQRDGLTGHAEELLPAAKADSGWLGGPGEDWEKGPYYVKGLVPLAWTLGDDVLKKKAQKWIDGILASQREDGFFGPKKNDDWWPRMVATYALRDYHEATGDARVLPFLTRYYAHMEKALPGRPLREWGKARAADEIDTIFWLYNRTGDDFLLRVADLLRAQAFDWPQIFRKNTFLFNGGEMISHNVNVPQAQKFPAVWYQRSRLADDRDALYAGERHLAREHGFPIGINSGTEHLAGRSPTQGVETCSIVEKMLSQETNLRILGDAALGDNLEVLAYNALPGAFSKAIKQHVYYTRPNNVMSVLRKSGFWQDYDDGTVPSPMCAFPCCCYNLHMGWPKFAQNCWAATHDGGLAVLAYAPSEVRAKVGDGADVTIVEETNYPFEETIRFIVKTARPVEFPLELRMPGWCDAPSVSVGGKKIDSKEGAHFLRLVRTWSDGDEMVVEFPMKTRVVEGMNRSVSIERGPLVYSLEMKERQRVTKPQPAGFEQYEILSDSPWNYALALNTAQPEVALSSAPLAPGANPFDPATTPIRMKVRGRRLASWRVAWNHGVAFDPPFSPVESSEPEEELTLVPYGTQYLRITSFPVLGKPAPPPREFADDFSKGWTAWNCYRGGWFIEDGAFRCTPGQPGGKAIVAGSDFADLELEVTVAVGRAGNAGLLFRASDFGTGVDEHNGYYVGIDPGARGLIAGKADGKWKELAKTSHPLEADQFVRLRVIARGPRVQVFLGNDAQPAMEFSDPEFTHGAIGLRQYLPDAKTGSVRFTRFVAKAL